MARVKSLTYIKDTNCFPVIVSFTVLTHYKLLPLTYSAFDDNEGENGDASVDKEKQRTKRRMKRKKWDEKKRKKRNEK